MLTQQQLHTKTHNTIRIYNFLKRKRLHKKLNTSNRYTAIMLCVLKLVNVVFLLIANIVILVQEETFFGMIRIYSCIFLIMNLDKEFMLF